MKRYLHFLPFLIIIFISLFHLVIFSQFSPTWDFPENLLIGKIELHEIPSPSDLTSLPYGVVTDIGPILLANLLPKSWQPNSFLLLGIIIGIIGILFFYRLLKDNFATRIVFFSSLTLFLLPRFVGHLHTNTKDIASASFILISIYFFDKAINKKQLFSTLLTVISFSLAVSTKPTSLQFIPVLFLWITFVIIINRKNKPYLSSHLPFFMLFLAVLTLIPVLIWILLWPHWLVPLLPALKYESLALSLLPKEPFYYSFKELLITTPLPILVLLPFGLYLLWKKTKRNKNSISFVMLIMFFYPFLKYMILPITDDIRYFIEIYYPLSLAFVLGVDFIARKYALIVFALIFLYCGYLLYQHHPYQINYYNLLAKDQDADFWASSYQEVFRYINRQVAPGKVVSARLAPELAAYLIRPDLLKDLNSKDPDSSDYVIILNRASFFQLFQVDNFIATHTPTKLFTDKTGTILTYLYKLD